MPLTLFGFASPRFHLQLSNPMPTVIPISKFALAPKPWAAFKNSYATILSFHVIRWSMNSLIYLPASLRIFSTILSMTIRMMIPTIPTLIYLLSTPTIQPSSPNFSKMMFVQLHYQPTSRRQTLKQYKRSVGCTHSDKGPPGPLVEFQEATPCSQVTETCPELAVCPHPKQPKKFPPLARHSQGEPSNCC